MKPGLGFGASGFRAIGPEPHAPNPSKADYIDIFSDAAFACEGERSRSGGVVSFCLR